MKTLSVNIEFPSDILGALDVHKSHLSVKLRELIVLELLREGKVSTGKAGELLGISKKDIVPFLAKHDVPYFTESPEELNAQVETITDILDEK